MTRLSVNLNKIALIRNSRGSDFPNLVEFARLCIDAGAQGLTIHPRPDQRHAKYSDVHDLAALLADYPEVELNVEGNPVDPFMEVVLACRPEQCTLVPDEPGQLTSDHGWKVSERQGELKDYVACLHDAGIRTSIFLDPDPDQLEAVPATGSDRIELYTESYAKAFATAKEDEVFAKFAATAERAGELGVGVNAGHDLNQANLGKFLSIPGILEVSIGHALTVESLVAGLAVTLGSYLEITRTAAQAASHNS